MAESLGSWVDSSVKGAIADFIASVTDHESATFVPQELRVAVFDNDGTLWCEQPLAQGVFIAQRLAAMAHEDVSLRDTQPWKAVFEGNRSWIGDAVAKHYRGDDTDLELLLSATFRAFGNIRVEDFEAEAAEFLDSAIRPLFERPYHELGYAPMIEWLAHLEANGFVCYIVSAGGREFMRPLTESVYGIPRERVIGSSSELTFTVDRLGARVLRTAAAGIIDDGPMKPIQIWERIGRRPILAVGNANGDIPMLQFSGNQSSPTLGLLVRHDDATREYAYATGAERALEM